MKHRLLTLPRSLLAVLSRLYSLAVQFRLVLYRTGYLKPKRLKAPTISVGNLTAGGTGKTPLVENLARYFSSRGYAVNILTRGYGRKQPGRRQIVSDGRRILEDAEFAGDEPLMLAHHLPGVRIIADANRYEAGKWAEDTLGVNLHILDDGYQHLAVERDVNLLVIDGLDPFGGEQPLPLGRLREPLSEMSRATAIIITHADHPLDQQELESRITTLAGNKPFFYAYRESVELWNPIGEERLPVQRLIGRSVAAICAIAQPSRFLSDLQHFQPKIVFNRTFPDHHYFRQREIDEASRLSLRAGAEWVLTTEKDWMRLQRLSIPQEPTLWVLRSKMVVIEEAQLLGVILKNLAGESASLL